MSALGITPPSTFRMIRSEGNPHDVGLNHGRLLGDLIDQSLHYYRNRLARLGLPWQQVLAHAGQGEAAIGGFDPRIAEELRGIAQGAEVELRAIYALNIRTPLARIAQPEAALAETHECTTGAVCGGLTQNGHHYLLQNWDQKADLQAVTVVFEQHIADEPALLYVAEAGRLIQHGLNAHGVGVCGNQLTAKVAARMENAGLGALARRRALRQTTLEAAVQAIHDTPRAISQNHLLGDRSGRAIDLEVTPDKIYEVSPTAGILSHANHFEHDDAGRDFEDLGRSLHPHSLHRSRRLGEVLAPYTGKIGLTELKLALSDHYGDPDGICRHPDGTQDELGHTLASTIMDLTEASLTTAPGPACIGTYTRYGFR